MIDLRLTDDLDRSLLRKPARVQRGLEAGMAAVGEAVVDDLRPRLPKATGALRRSLRAVRKGLVVDLMAAAYVRLGKSPREAVDDYAKSGEFDRTAQEAFGRGFAGGAQTGSRPTIGRAAPRVRSRGE